MSDLNSETIAIQEKSIDFEPRPLPVRLAALLLSQRSNLQNLSVLVFVNLLVAGIGFITKVKIANIIGKADFGLFAYGFAIAAYGGTIISV